MIKPSGKTNITLSIDEVLFGEIKKEAKLGGTSINAKVNAILTKYVKFYKMNEELGSIVLPLQFWASLIDRVDVDLLESVMSKESLSTIHSIFLNSNTTLTPDSFVKHYCKEICLWSSTCSSIKEFKEDGTTVLIFGHNYGLKWSKVLGRMLCDFVKNTFAIIAEAEVRPLTVKLMIAEEEKIPEISKLINATI